MKILAIHNFHRSGSASGDDQVYKVETALLESKGHEVIRYTISNDLFDHAGALSKLASAFGMFWSFRYYRDIKRLVKEERPDVVHIHTFFPLLSPSILYAAKRNGARVVATLHDTRFICPCATSLRDGKLCNACGDGKYLRMAKYGCFKGSKLQSLIVACIFKYHRIRKSFYKQIDEYICLNDNQMRLLNEVGFEQGKMIKKYNFVEDTKNEYCTEAISEKQKLPDRYVVFYGRIGEEKGIRILMDLWNGITDIPLVIMGGGPLQEEVEAWSSKHSEVYFLGYTPHEECLSIVSKSEFVVFPSIWYEGCSMVEIETESLGKGLVATDLGFSAEAIQNGVNGYKVPLGDVEAFRNQIRTLWCDPSECMRIGKGARVDYEQKYLPEENYQQLLKCYQNVIGDMLRISVIVPFYKGNQYVERLLNSVMEVAKATLGRAEFDVIFVNDSPDCEVVIPDGYKEQLTIRVMNHCENQGIQQARVNGLLAAEGDWIIFLDQDDILLKDGFAAQLDLTEQSDVVIGNGYYQKNNIQEKIFQNQKIMKYFTQRKSLVEIRNLIPSPGLALIKKECIPDLWKQRVLSENGSDDWYLWLLLLANNRHFACNEHMVYVHMETEEGNLSYDLSKMKASNDELVTIFEENDIYSKKERNRFRQGIEFKYIQDTQGLSLGVIFKHFSPFIKNVIYRVKRRIKSL